MFSTPIIRMNNQENLESVMRKPAISSARKAFQDRDVNNKCLTPQIGKLAIQKNHKLFCDASVTPASVKKQQVIEDFLESMTEECSYTHQIDTYQDIIDPKIRHSKSQLFNFFTSVREIMSPAPLKDETTIELDPFVLQIPTPDNDFPSHSFDELDDDLFVGKPTFDFVL